VKHRHEMHHKGKMKRADGGKAEFYAGAGSNVAKEAEEKKHGGKVHKKRKHGGHVHGEMAKKRLDKPGRKRGGAVGADMKPLSSAFREKDAVGHSTEDDD